MTSWSELSEELVKPIPDMADSLSCELETISDIKCIHFEKLVEKMGPKGFTPKCVDSMVASGKTVYLIEFKPIPQTGGNDISDSITLKALESAIIYLRFLSHRYNSKRLGMIIVTQDHRQEYAKAISEKAGLGPHSNLDRYKKHDMNNDTMFYDSIELMACEEFIEFARKHLSPKHGNVTASGH